MKVNKFCTLADGFSFWEKIYAQFSFFALGIIATVGIAITDWPLIVVGGQLYYCSEDSAFNN